MHVGTMLVRYPSNCCGGYLSELNITDWLCKAEQVWQPMY